MSRLVLFDLDGTLLRTQGAGMRAMTRAGAELFGDCFRFDGITIAGGLDPLLFAAAAQRCGVVINNDNHDRFADAYFRELGVELDAAAKVGDVCIMPGVPELLDDMHAHPEIALGLLTGNYTRTAPVKLIVGGLDPDIFIINAFGDDAPDRPSLVPVATQRYRQQHQHDIAPHHVMLIGDTPRDIEAAKTHGAIAVGVATGPYTVEQLNEAGADLALENLSNPAPLWQLLNL